RPLEIAGGSLASQQSLAAAFADPHGKATQVGSVPSGATLKRNAGGKHSSSGWPESPSTITGITRSARLKALKAYLLCATLGEHGRIRSLRLRARRASARRRHNEEAGFVFSLCRYQGILVFPGGDGKSTALRSISPDTPRCGFSARSQ